MPFGGLWPPAAKSLDLGLAESVEFPRCSHFASFETGRIISFDCLPASGCVRASPGNPEQHDLDAFEKFAELSVGPVRWRLRLAKPFGLFRIRHNQNEPEEHLPERERAGNRENCAGVEHSRTIRLRSGIFARNRLETGNSSLATAGTSQGGVKRDEAEATILGAHP